MQNSRREVAPGLRRNSGGGRGVRKGEGVRLTYSGKHAKPGGWLFRWFNQGGWTFVIQFATPLVPATAHPSIHRSSRLYDHSRTFLMQEAFFLVWDIAIGGYSTLFRRFILPHLRNYFIPRLILLVSWQVDNDIIRVCLFLLLSKGIAVQGSI